MKDPSDYSPDDIRYAVETTKVHFHPQRRIETFGDTKFDFVMLSEMMDEIDVVRVRSGWVEAEKPKIISPQAYKEISTEGFGDDAKKFFDWLEKHGKDFGALLQYGFRFKRSEVRNEILHEPIEVVRGRILDEANSSDRSMFAVIEGVDDAWEVCLLQFAVEMVQKSHESNIVDFRRNGLL